MQDYKKVKKIATLVIILAIIFNGWYLLSQRDPTNSSYIYANSLLIILVFLRVFAIVARLFNFVLLLLSGAKNHSKQAGGVWPGFLLMVRNISVYIFLPAIVLTSILLLIAVLVNK